MSAAQQVFPNCHFRHFKVALSESFPTLACVFEGSNIDSISIAPLSKSPGYSSTASLEHGGRSVVLGRESTIKVLGHVAKSEEWWLGYAKKPKQGNAINVEWRFPIEEERGQELIVVDRKGDPVHDAVVSYGLEAPFDSGDPDFLLGGVTEATDREGKTYISVLKSGKYIMRVKNLSKQVHLTGAYSAVLPASKTVRLSAASFMRSSSVMFQPLLPLGVDTIDYLDMHLQRSGNPNWTRHILTANTKAGMVLNNLLPGMYHVRVGSGYLYNDLYVKIDDALQNTIQIPLEYGQIISGHLYDEEGLPLSGRWVSLATEDPTRPNGGYPWERGYTSPEGKFTLLGSPEDSEPMNLKLWSLDRTSVDHGWKVHRGVDMPLNLMLPKDK